MVFIIIGCCFCLFWLLNVAYKRTAHYNRAFEQVQKFKDVPEGLELINLGSNYAMYGLNYDGIIEKAFNFALGPQYLLYDYRVLLANAKKCSEGCVVLITFPPAVFCFDGSGCQDEKYYFFLPAALLPNHSWLKRMKRVVFPLLFRPWDIRFLLERHKKMTPAQVTPMQSEAQCEDEAIKRVNGWVDQFGLDDMVSDRFPQAVTQQFEKTTTIVSEMIDFCFDNAFNPVLVIPPVSQSLRRRLGEKFLKGALFDNLKRANTRGVPVLDYLSDEDLAAHSLYMNSDFLNADGAKIFTSKVLEDLHERHYLSYAPRSSHKIHEGSR